MNGDNQPRPVLYRVHEDDPSNRNPSNYRPAFVVWEIGHESLANLVVFLDGSNDRHLLSDSRLGLYPVGGDGFNGALTAWATSRKRGDGIGEWMEQL